MRQRDVDTTEMAVGRLLPRLTPTAVLMTDDPGSAVGLLSRVLSEPQALDSPEDAMQALARFAVRPPRWASEQVIESRQATGWADEDTALAEALRALPDRESAAVVLRLVAGVGPAATDGPVADLRSDLARRDEEQERERSRAAALFRRPGSTPDPAPPARDLTERLALLAAGRPLPETAPATITAAIGAARRTRRGRRLSLAAVVLVAAVLAALVPLLPRAPVPPPPASVYAGPTRGSLAGDEDFLRAIRESGWELAAETTGSRRVVFAGDVPGGRWALLAAGGSPSRPATTAWFTGPVGASPDRMALLTVRVAPDPAEPVSVTDPASGALVVIAAAGDRIRVSDRPEVDAGGTLRRRFRAVPSSRGAAVVGLTPVPRARLSAVRVHVTRRDRQLDVHEPTVVADPGAPPVDVTVSSLRSPSPSAVVDAAVAPRLRAVLGQLGQPVRDTAVTSLWSGELPGPNDQPARLTVLAVPQTSGAVVVTTPYSYAADHAGRTGSSWCGTGVLLAGIPLPQRVVAVQCDLSDLAADREISRFLVVVAPPSATSVRLLDDSGAVLRELALDDGVAVVRSPGHVAQVDVTTADGGTSSTVPLADTDLTG
ncbi:MAG TPA: hypothetical protein VGN28_00550 [Blastococcus sp.]|jgi:hypothetical protein|nr:hypothetical protein [Blastococcus sp.]